jgi:hypothetical protein
MFELKVVEELDAPTRELPQAGREREALLAALAATLVEHRRRLNSGDGCGSAPGTGGNWRTMARWEQLQGKA